MLLVLAACGDDRFVDVTIDVEPCARAAGSRLVVEVRDAQEGVVDTFEASLEASALPTGVRIRRRSDGSSGGFHVLARILDPNGVPIAFESARGSFGDAAREVGVVFDDACLGIECPFGSTCVAAECVSDVDPAPDRGEPRASCPPMLFVDGMSGTGPECTFAAPCRTLDDALDLVEAGAGAVVHVHGGTYTSNDSYAFAVREERAGGENAPLVIKAWPDTGLPILEGGVDSEITVSLDASHVVLDGFEIRGGYAHGISINGAGISNVTVRNCDVHHGERGDPPPPREQHPYDNRAGLVINNNAGNITLDHSRFRDNAAVIPDVRISGLHINAGRNVRISSCVVTGNERHGVFISGSDVSIADTLIANNGGEGVIGSTAALEVERVRVCESMVSGISLTGTSRATVARSTIARSGADALLLDAQAAAVVRGNVFANNGGAAINRSDARVTIEESHNLYFGNANATAGFDRSAPDTDVLEDPLFTDASCDLVLAPGSPARGAGPDGGDLGAP
jgi:hypothetical protein